MAIATHLGPWLLGTVKSTSGTTAGTVRNTGATIVAQQITLVPSVAVTCYIPAGATITSVQSYMTTGAVGTPNVVIAGVTVGTLSTAAGVNSLSGAATTGAATTMQNVGTTDALLSYTATAASAGYLVVAYVVKNSDGTMYASSTTGP